MNKASGTALITTNGVSYPANLTFNGAGTFQLQDNITFSGNGKKLSESNGTFDCNSYDVTIAITSGSTFTLANTMTLYNLIFNSSDKNDNLILQGDLTVTNLMTLSGVNAGGRVLLSSDVPGTTRTLTCASVAFTNVDFSDITAAGAAAPFTGTVMGDALGNSNITFDTPVTRYWVATSGGNWGTTTGQWASSSGGAATASVPLPQDTVIFDANSIIGGSTIIVNVPRMGKDIDFSAVTNSPILNVSQAAGNFGSLTLSSGMTITGFSVWTFWTRSSSTFTSGGLNLEIGVTWNMFGGTLTLQDTCNFVQGPINLNYGTLTVGANNMNFTTGILILGIGSKTLNMGSGTWTFSNTGTTVNISSGTINCETSTIVINDTSASAKSFIGGGKTYNILTITGDNVTISGNNTFTTLNVNTAGLTNGLKVTANSTQTVTNFTTNGSAGNLAKILSTTAGTKFTLTTASPQISVDYMSIKDSFATQTNTWYAGANSTNVSGNTNWLFTAPPGASSFIYPTQRMRMGMGA